MAITKAQQYQQLVKKDANGKRPGYRGPGGYQGGPSGDVERPGGGNRDNERDNNPRRGGAGPNPNKPNPPRRGGAGPNPNKPKSKPPRRGGAGPNPNKTKPKSKDKPNIIEPKPKPEKKFNPRNLFRGLFPATTSVVNAINQSGIVRNLNAAQRQAYLDSLDLTDKDDKEEYDRIMNQLGGLGMDIIAGPKDLKDTRLSVPPSMLATDPMTQFKTVDGVSSLGDPGVKDVLGKDYQDYLDRFEKPEGRDGRDNQIIPPIIPTTTGSVTSEEEVDNRSELEKLLDARGPAFRFFADGGRVPAQQGGIMFRLNELGSGVSSAEEMLQQINQRLDSAESSLGGGEGMSAMGPSGFNTNFNQQSPPFSPIQNSVSNSDPSKFFSLFNSGLLPNGFNSPEGNKPIRRGLSIEDSPFAGPRDRLIADPPRGPRNTVIADPPPRRPFNRMELQERFESMYPPGHPMRNFGYMRDGGRAGYNVGGMANDDDPVGGIMDLESGRQMYFLGKLVKKATKTIKKIVKSPVGKLALGAAALNFGGGFSGLLKKGLLKKGATNFSLANLSPMKAIGLASLASGLMTPKQEEEEEDVYLGPSIDIPAIRRDPYGAMGGAYSFYADGGKAEPVAKKTMPLIDMNGMEKDYRETGGFVEMGRMERADDVPARLSKNEFVFTADAVRNAGEGDIDKGAEVMYNMMKNLESGGEVSEESQGLEGAKKMFQTSQRLGEVI